MNNKYIPEVLKDKLSLFVNILYATFILLVAVFLAISMLTFNLNDNSFLTYSSNNTQNLLGAPGSFISSFIFYTFGVMGYLLILFFLLDSKKDKKKVKKYFKKSI